MGDRGTAKSVAVRSMIDLLPEIDVVTGDPFNSHPSNPELMAGSQGTPLPYQTWPCLVTHGLTLSITTRTLTSSLMRGSLYDAHTSLSCDAYSCPTALCISDPVSPFITFHTHSSTTFSQSSPQLAAAATAAAAVAVVYPYNTTTRKLSPLEALEPQRCEMRTRVELLKTGLRALRALRALSNTPHSKVHTAQPLYVSC